MRLSASELSRFGEDLGRQLRAPAVIGLSGELGTGKTTLVQVPPTRSFIITTPVPFLSITWIATACAGPMTRAISASTI